MPHYSVFRDCWASNCRQSDTIEAASLEEARDYAENWAYEDCDWAVDGGSCDSLYVVYRKAWICQSLDYDEITAEDIEAAKEYAKEWCLQDLMHGAKRIHP